MSRHQEESLPSGVVVGVDTHRDFHVAVVIPRGALLGAHTFPATRAGYANLLRWARTFGHVDRAGVECTGSYGSAISRHLTKNDISVIEVNRTDRSTRRRRGKSDTIDAEAAARAVLGGYAQAQAKSADGHVEICASSSWPRNPPPSRGPKRSTS